MKRMIVMLVVAAVTAGSLFATNALAVEASGDAYAGVYSDYLWRGDNLGSELFDDNFVIQSGADISISNFTIGWWGNYSENRGDLTETDIVLDYTFSPVDKLSVSAGNILYAVDGASTYELYLGASLDTLLAPSATVYFDYDDYKTIYATVGISHGIDVKDGLSVSLGATMGAFLDDGDSNSFLNNLELSASADYALTDQVTLGAMLMASTPLSDDAEHMGYTIGDEVMGGVSATFAF